MTHYGYVYTTERFLARKKDVSGVGMEDYWFAAVTPGDFMAATGHNHILGSVFGVGEVKR